MQLAPACRGHEPRVFEAGWCHACGLLLDPVADAGEGLDGIVRLDVMIERERMKLPELARADGVDPADVPAYRAWLEARLETV